MRYLYTIQNSQNGEILSPVGSHCIEKFGREELTNRVRNTESLFRHISPLLQAVREHRAISLADLSDKLLRKLYDDDAFPPNQYNHNNGHDDYDFLLKMRRRLTITEKQQQKISCIIRYSIRPYLESKIRT